MDNKVAALTGGTAASSETMRTALLHGETFQEAQVHSGDKVDTPLTHPSAD